MKNVRYRDGWDKWVYWFKGKHILLIAHTFVYKAKGNFRGRMKLKAYKLEIPKRVMRA